MPELAEALAELAARAELIRDMRVLVARTEYKLGFTALELYPVRCAELCEALTVLIECYVENRRQPKGASTT